MSDDNYEVALKLFKEEFLDEEYIGDETFKLYSINSLNLTTFLQMFVVTSTTEAR